MTEPTDETHDSEGRWIARDGLLMYRTHEQEMEAQRAWYEWKALNDQA